jgi:hypothetical protein
LQKEGKMVKNVGPAVSKMPEEATNDIEAPHIEDLTVARVDPSAPKDIASFGRENEEGSPREDRLEQGDGKIEVSEEEMEAGKGFEEEMIPVDHGRTTSGREGKQLGEDLMLAVKERSE